MWEGCISLQLDSSMFTRDDSVVWQWTRVVVLQTCCAFILWQWVPCRWKWTGPWEQVCSCYITVIQDTLGTVSWSFCFRGCPLARGFKILWCPGRVFPLLDCPLYYLRHSLMGFSFLPVASVCRTVTTIVNWRNCRVYLAQTSQFMDLHVLVTLHMSLWIWYSRRTQRRSYAQRNPPAYGHLPRSSLIWSP